MPRLAGYLRNQTAMAFLAAAAIATIVGIGAATGQEKGDAGPFERRVITNPRTIEELTGQPGKPPPPLYQQSVTGLKVARPSPKT
jgi:hypothetical protein